MVEIAHYDVRVQYGLLGSPCLITPLTPAAKDWIEENISPEGWQWLGKNLCVNPNTLELLINDLRDSGLLVDD